MGVPAFFRWLSEKYPLIISSVREAQPQVVGDEEIPVDITTPNPNGEEFDNLYLDMNGIVHPCSHPEDRPAPKNEEEMMLAIFEYTERVVNMVRPRKILMIAVDGVAPRAKMNQQRSRRFRSALDAKKKEEQKAEFRRQFLHKMGEEEDDEDTSEEDKVWDSNVITPGTPFMDTLALSLRYWTAYKVNTDPGWRNLKIIISDATVPGEGEHKIMEFVRSQRRSQEHDPNTRHVIYGLDADLIMLGLATHEPHFRVLREDVFYQSGRPRTCRICGQEGHLAADCTGQAKSKPDDQGENKGKPPKKPFIWLHINVLREYLEQELFVPQLDFRFDLERAIDDWVFLCFFVGNDFLPHLPSLEIREEGIDVLTAIWRDNLALMGGYVTEDGTVNLERAQYILNGLAKQEDAIFKSRKAIEDRREAGRKRRRLMDERNDSRRGNGGQNTPTDLRRQNSNKRQDRLAQPPPDFPVFTPDQANSREVRNLTHDMFVNRKNIFQQTNESNKSAAAVMKEKLMSAKSVDTSNDAEDEKTPNVPDTETPPSVLGKRKADMVDESDNGTPGRTTPIARGVAVADPDDPPPDEIRLWEEGYADRYYERKFGVDPKDIDFRHQVANAYVEGLCWVLRYYMQGCPSWTWYYPYHYAPFAADFFELKQLDIRFDVGTPFKPFEQLMGVLPARSNHAIPEPFRILMTDEESEIKEFYPEEFTIDLNGKKMEWQGVALLPFIDEKKLLAAMATKYPLLSAEDHARNEVGKDVLLFSTSHAMYEDIAKTFYSKKQNADKYKLKPKLSDGLSGIVEKDESYVPQTSLVSPLSEGLAPSLDEDQTMTVHYEMPRSQKVHKSMLLRGVQMPPPVLDHDEIQRTRSRARNSGRNFGGAPLRNSYQNGYGRGDRINYANPQPSYNNNNNYNNNPNYEPMRGGPRAPPPAHLRGPYDYPPADNFRNGPPPPMPQWGGHQYPAPPFPPRYPPQFVAGGAYARGGPPPPHFTPPPFPPQAFAGGPPPPPPPSGAEYPRGGYRQDDSRGYGTSYGGYGGYGGGRM